MGDVDRTNLFEQKGSQRSHSVLISIGAIGRSIRSRVAARLILSSRSAHRESTNEVREQRCQAGQPRLLQCAYSNVLLQRGGGSG